MKNLNIKISDEADAIIKKHMGDNINFHYKEEAVNDIIILFGKTQQQKQ